MFLRRFLRRPEDNIIMLSLRKRKIIYLGAWMLVSVGCWMWRAVKNRMSQVLTDTYNDGFLDVLDEQYDRAQC